MPLESSDANTATEGVIRKLIAGGGGEATRIVCGYVSCNREALQPLLKALPAVVVVPIGISPDILLLRQVLQSAIGKSATPQTANASTLAKLAELLFVEAIRCYADNLPPESLSWLSGLKDPQIGKVLTLLHTEPDKAWTVDALSKTVAMSRSALAERFTSLVGESPIQYLTKLRLAAAAHELSTGKQPVGKIAERAGYESEASFSRAFKRQYGAPPATWRRTRIS